MSKFERRNDWKNLATMAGESVTITPHRVDRGPNGREFMDTVASELIAIAQKEGVAPKLREEGNQWPQLLAAAAARMDTSLPKVPRHNVVTFGRPTHGFGSN